MALIKTKAGVKPHCLGMMAAVANVAQMLTTPLDVVITAGTDGAHMAGSKHYIGEALDIRSKGFPNRATKKMFIEQVLGRLGPGYQMFVESEGTENEHFHLEYDPGPAAA
jgi:hypothetical protein